MSKIKVTSIYIGNIMKVLSNEIVIKHKVHIPGISLNLGQPKFKSERFKENAILIKVAENGYVDFDSYDELKVKKCLNTNESFILDGTIIPATLSPILQDLYIDPKSLKPFPIGSKQDDILIDELDKVFKKSNNF